MSHSINWFPWCRETFRKALWENKPLLMYLTAPWCSWCSVMEETTYRDSGVVKNIERRFVPMMVNIDQLPHVADRYHSGGYPSVVFLFGDGNILWTEKYLTPEQMLDVLDNVCQLYRGRNREKDRLSALKGGYTWKEAGQKIKASVQGVQDGLIKSFDLINNSFDKIYGGFGIYSFEPKFPYPEINEFLCRYINIDPLSSAGAMLEKTLDAMGRGEIFDSLHGGFFRVCDNRDWTDPHFEKMLETNALLLQNYLRTYRLLGNGRYKEISRDIIRYLLTDLFDEEQGLFSGSQAGGGPEKGAVDKIPYTNWNSVTASALMEASLVFNEGEFLRISLSVIESLWRNYYSPGLGMKHYLACTSSETVVLSDQVKYCNALLDAFNCTGEAGYLERVRILVKNMNDNFYIEGQGYSDIPLNGEKLGYLKIPYIPVTENTEAAQIYLALSKVLGDKTFLSLAQRLAKSIEDQAYSNVLFSAKYGSMLADFYMGK